MNIPIGSCLLLSLNLVVQSFQLELLQLLAIVMIPPLVPDCYSIVLCIDTCVRPVPFFTSNNLCSLSVSLDFSFVLFCLYLLPVAQKISIFFQKPLTFMVSQSIIFLSVKFHMMDYPYCIDFFFFLSFSGIDQQMPGSQRIFFFSFRISHVCGIIYLMDPLQMGLSE